MDSPDHEGLAGDPDRDERIAPEARDEGAAPDAAIDAIVAPLRAAVVPDLSARIMARVAATRIEPSRAGRVAGAVRRWLASLWTPRPVTIRLRPVYAVGALAVLALFLVLTPSSALMPWREGTVADASAEPRIYVQFRLEAEGASRVALAGSFTGWKPAYQLRETSPGTWSILVPLRPGVHDYAFVIDGKGWVPDPLALQVDDGFGGTNSRIALPARIPDRSAS